MGSLFLLQGIFPTQGSNPVSCIPGAFVTSWATRKALNTFLQQHRDDSTHGQEPNPGVPRCRWILYQLSLKGSPRILEWVAYPFSNGSFQSRNRTGVSYIAGGFFTNWAIRKAPKVSWLILINSQIMTTSKMSSIPQVLWLQEFPKFSYFKAQTIYIFPGGPNIWVLKLPKTKIKLYLSVLEVLSCFRFFFLIG